VKTKMGMVFVGAFATVLISAGPGAADPASVPTPVPYSFAVECTDIQCAQDGGNSEAGVGGGGGGLPKLSSMVPWPLSQLLSMIGL
jgi:hypothetical protein